MSSTAIPMHVVSSSPGPIANITDTHPSPVLEPSKAIYLWIPYTLLTLLLAGLTIASFLHYHFKHRNSNAGTMVFSTRKHRMNVGNPIEFKKSRTHNQSDKARQYISQTNDNSSALHTGNMYTSGLGSSLQQPLDSPKLSTQEDGVRYNTKADYISQNHISTSEFPNGSARYINKENTRVTDNRKKFNVKSIYSHKEADNKKLYQTLPLTDIPVGAPSRIPHNTDRGSLHSSPIHNIGGSLSTISQGVDYMITPRTLPPLTNKSRIQRPTDYFV